MRQGNSLLGLAGSCQHATFAGEDRAEHLAAERCKERDTPAEKMQCDALAAKTQSVDLIYLAGIERELIELLVKLVGIILCESPQSAKRERQQEGKHGSADTHSSDHAACLMTRLVTGLERPWHHAHAPQFRKTNHSPCGRPLESGEQTRQQRGPPRQSAHPNIFAGAVRALSHGAQTIQSWDTKRGGEVSIRAAPGESLAK